MILNDLLQRLRIPVLAEINVQALARFDLPQRSAARLRW